MSVRNTRSASALRLKGSRIWPQRIICVISHTACDRQGKLAAPRWKTTRVGIDDIRLRATADQVAGQRPQQDFLSDADVARPRQDTRRLGPVRRLIEPAAGGDDGAHKIGDDLGVLLGPGLADAEHFLGASVPELAFGCDDHAVVLDHGDAVPGLADAKPSTRPAFRFSAIGGGGRRRD